MMRRIYPHKALVPTMPWIPATTPGPPQLTGIAGSQAEGVRLEWKDTTPETASYYVIYRFNMADSVDTGNASRILEVVPRTAYANQSWVDHNTKKRTAYRYLITAVDRLHNESTPSMPAQIRITGKRRPVKIIKEFTGHDSLKLVRVQNP
jgi:fibronectin type 3 domain-containing protein